MQNRKSSYRETTCFRLYLVLLMAALTQTAPATAQQRDSVASDSAAHCSGMTITASNKIQKTFGIAPGKNLFLDTELGDVSVRPWNRNKVQVIVELHGSESEINRFDLRMTGDTNAVSVRAGKRPKKFSFSLGWSRLEVRYVVKVPREFNVNVRTENGDLNVSYVAGTTKLESVSGDISVRELNGSIHIRTASGEIQAQKLSGDVRLQASDGDVVLINAVGSVDAATSGGGDIVLTNVQGKVDAATRSGNIRVSLAGAHQGLQLNAQNGDIDIYLSPHVSGTIEASTRSGEVSTNLSQEFRGNIRSHNVHGALNGGGSLIRAVTNRGDITIRKK